MKTPGRNKISVHSMYVIKSIGDHSVEIAEIISIVCLLYINPYLLSVYIVGVFINAYVN